MLTLTEKLNLAGRVAKTAGDNLLSKHGFRVEQKAMNDFVTEVDRETEQFIRNELLAQCPEDSFLGEEYGVTDGGEGCWIVDPIDGTTNFIRGIPLYTVSIGYRVRGELLLGCVYCPRLGELYMAESGKGATLNGESIHVSQIADHRNALVAISFSHRNMDDRKRMMKLLSTLTELNDMRRTGSAAFDLCQVACGRTEGFIELRLNIYDIAAGIVILKEAGGTVTGWPNEPDCTETGNVLATNALITEYLTATIKAI